MLDNWPKIKESYVYKGFRSVISKTFKLPGGSEVDFDIIDGSSFVSVATFTQDGQMLLVKQFRPGPECVTIGVPAGYIDPGEQPEEAAARELLEETGYQAGKMVFLKKILSAYAHIDKVCFVAIDCVKVSEPRTEEHEVLEIEQIPLAEVPNLLRDSKDSLLGDIDSIYLGLDYLQQQNLYDL